MEASTLYGDKHPKPRFYSQASSYLLGLVLQVAIWG